MIDPTRQQPAEKREDEAPLHDTQTIVQRHLEDKDHVITDEEIRNVKVGDVEDEVSPVGAEAQARFEDEDDTLGTDEKGTPWDVVK